MEFAKKKEKKIGKFKIDSKWDDFLKTDPEFITKVGKMINDVTYLNAISNIQCLNDMS